MKCPMCEKADIKLQKKEFKMYGVSLGIFDTEICPACGEELFDEKTSALINKKAKEKGLWGLESKTKVGKSGNSLIIRVSKQIADFMELHTGEEVHLHPEGKNKLVVEC